MGQYFKPILRRNGRMQTYSTWVRVGKNADLSRYNDFDRQYILEKGMYYMLCKLMEHSYWGNPLVDGIAQTILENPAQVAWIGDYADSGDFPDKFELARRREGRAVMEPSPKFTMHNKFLINNTKRRYISCEQFYQDHVWHEKFDGREISWCYNPLSLLTAVGNGAGGGDFYGNGSERIGEWVFDEILLSEQEPEGYARDRFIFEKRK